MGPVVTETARIRLRAWTIEDAEGFMRLASDPEVVRYISGGVPYTRAQVGLFVQRQLDTQRERGWGRWAIELTQPDRAEHEGVVGFCGPGCTFAPEVEVGWWLLRSLWGEGLATEAARAAVEHCFDVIGFPRLISCIHRDNAASLRVAEKVGFARAGEFEYARLPLIRHELANPTPPQALGVRWHGDYCLDCATLPVDTRH